MGQILCKNKDGICAKISYTIPSEPVYVENISENFIYHPFGPRNKVTWEELENFLESRCFPKERPNCKELLRLLEVQYYDPWEIIKVTKGKMCEDDMELQIVD